jgi:hypothetical protein
MARLRGAVSLPVRMPPATAPPKRLGPEGYAIQRFRDVRHSPASGCGLSNSVDGGQAMSEPFEYAWEITAVVATVVLLVLHV